MPAFTLNFSEDFFPTFLDSKPYSISEEPRAGFHQPRVPEGKDSATTFQTDPEQVGILVNGNGNVRTIRHDLRVSRRRQIVKSGLLEPEPCDTGGGFVVNCEVLTYIQLLEYQMW